LNRSRRSFTAQFKSEVVLALLTGAKSQAELCREHALSASLVSQWKDAFLANASAAFVDPDQRSEESARLAEMERLVGRLSWENDALKKGSALLRQGLLKGGKS
jgi:transposase-like protein